METEIIARLSGVQKVYESDGVRLTALDDVSLTLYRGDFAVLVGASGSGKSTLLNVLGTLDRPTKGEVRIAGVDVTTQSDRALSRLRLASLGFIFQSFNLVEVLTVAENIEYPLTLAGARRSAARARVEWLMEQVGLTGHRDHRVTHLSGGQRQRVAIARALMLNPRLLVLDEPVSALDLSVQAQVLNLLQDLQDEFHLTYVFISHDLSVVRHIADDVMVMYFGEAVEYGPRDDVFNNPQHSYTKTLFAATPRVDVDAIKARIATRRKAA